MAGAVVAVPAGYAENRQNQPPVFIKRLLLREDNAGPQRRKAPGANAAPVPVDIAGSRVVKPIHTIHLSSVDLRFLS